MSSMSPMTTLFDAVWTTGATKETADTAAMTLINRFMGTFSRVFVVVNADQRYS